jgi:hypothetical protein
MSGRLAIVALAALAVGCTRPRTEAVIVVQTAGVRIPIDVEKLHVQVADHQPGGEGPALNDPVYEQDVVLCHEGLDVGCYDVPVTAALFPGKQRPNDSVRVQIDAIGNDGKLVISDAALFTFADGQRLRLDFVLYANCLGNVECALRDQACGPDDQCVDLTPAPLGGKPDLGAIAVPDLAVPPPDLSGLPPGADLAEAPPDLTPAVDMAGCASVTCDMGTTCVAGSCVSCGGLGQPCCASGPQCASGNAICNGTLCIHCGAPAELCCAGNVCFGGSQCNTSVDQCQFPPPDMMSVPDMTQLDMDMSDMDMDMTPEDLLQSPGID